MNNVCFALLLALLLVIASLGLEGAEERYKSLSADSSVLLDTQTGRMRTLVLKGQDVPVFKQGEGEGISLVYERADGARVVPEMKRSSAEEDEPSFFGESEEIDFFVRYAWEGESLRLTVTAKNHGAKAFSPKSLALSLGLDTYMESFPSWNDKHFPTMLCTEKTHFWGYVMSPRGSIIALNSPDPIPSWKLLYNNGGHRINGIHLELLTSKKVPERSSRTQVSLLPGEERVWTLYLSRVNDLAEIPKIASLQTGAVMITTDRYTGEPGEECTLTFYEESTPPENSPSHPSPSLDNNSSAIPLPATHFPTSSLSATLISPVGFESPLDIRNGQAKLKLPTDYGLCKVLVKNARGKVSELMLGVRRPWSWYLHQARRAVIVAKQKPLVGIENWYGFFSAFDARSLEPSPSLDALVDANFEECMTALYEPETMKPKDAAYPERIQNHAGTAAQYAHKFRTSGDIRDLEKASLLADYVLSRQAEGGAYIGYGTTRYTSVIYIGKFLMELIDEEAKLAENDLLWKERHDRHLHSVQRAMKELATHLDNTETEGEMTFEDGMISCSYMQLAAWARHYATPEDRSQYIVAAEELLAKHRCLSQLIRPDARMNNASLRFWESQYDVLYCPNLICSPHGWSAWRLYGLFDLYRLTGKIDYLRQGMNGMGTCAQLLHPTTGELRWAFMVDPSIETDVFENDPAHPGVGKRTSQTIGESYRSMISSWWPGLCADNDVHEIFKCMAEHVLYTTWIYVKEENNASDSPSIVTSETASSSSNYPENIPPEIEAWNGAIKPISSKKSTQVANLASPTSSDKSAHYLVIPSESCVREVHVNTCRPLILAIQWGGALSPEPPRIYELTPGLHSLNREMSPPDVPHD